MKVYCRRLRYPNGDEPLTVIALNKNEKIIDISGDAHMVVLLIARDESFHLAEQTESFIFVWQNHLYQDKYGGSYSEVEIANDYRFYTKLTFQTVFKEVHTLFVFKQHTVDKEHSYPARFDLSDD